MTALQPIAVPRQVRRVPLLLALLLAACQSTQLPPAEVATPVAVPHQAAAGGTAEAPPAPKAPVAGDKFDPIPPRPTCCVNPRDRDPLDDATGPLTRREIFFGDDQFHLSAEAMALLEPHARYLVSRPQHILRLEGHADERGTREYNLALAQKRADAVARAFMLLGVRQEQVEAISFGKERPRAQGHDEAAWAQNRRVDLSYQR